MTTAKLLLQWAELYIESCFVWKFESIVFGFHPTNGLLGAETGVRTEPNCLIDDLVPECRLLRNLSFMRRCLSQRRTTLLLERRKFSARPGCVACMTSLVASVCINHLMFSICQNSTDVKESFSWVLILESLRATPPWISWCSCVRSHNIGVCEHIIVVHETSQKAFGMTTRFSLIHTWTWIQNWNLPNKSTRKWEWRNSQAEIIFFSLGRRSSLLSSSSKTCHMN